MQKNIWNELAEYIKNNRFRSVWKKVVRVLACVVVFCTTYALILPAITMEQKTYCGLKEHTHIKSCYKEIRVPSELICPLVEMGLAEEFAAVSDGDAQVDLHTHTEECYAVPKKAPLTCELEENDEHKHDFLCYGNWELVCTEEEHSHSLECFSDREADVENASVWENMIWNLELSGIWAEDVVTIAKSQLGYQESVRNYVVNEDTTIDGYTRYGAWIEEPYGDWEAAFAAFCIYHADVEGMPLESDIAEWIASLQKADLYIPASEREPQLGDLLFVDTDDDDTADHVGFISEVIQATEEKGICIKVIQGDSANKVQYVTYDTGILGYGVLPKQLNPVRSYTYSDEEVWVKVKLPMDTTVPKNAQLQVTAVSKDSTQYADLFSQAEEAVDQNVVQARFYDISFYTADCKYIPVTDKARVMMRFADEMVDARDKTVVLHYEEGTSEPTVLEDVSVTEEAASATMTLLPGQEAVEYTDTLVSYETEGFSVFGLVEVETGVVSGGNNGGNVITETYVTRVPATTDQYSNGSTHYLHNLYNWVQEQGSVIFAIHSNLQNDQKVSLTSEQLGDNLIAKPIVSNAELSLEGFDVTIEANQNHLWRFTPGPEVNTFYIESVANPGYYLSLGGTSNNTFTITQNMQEVTAVVDGNNNLYLSIRYNEQDNYLVYYNQYNAEILTFITSGYHGDGIFLSEYTGSQEPDEEPEEPETGVVINLDGKTFMLVAVNNNNGQYAGLTTTQEGGGFQAPILSNVAFDNGTMIITEEDAQNRMAFTFEAAETPGYYYIKSANFYGDTTNDTAGKYLNMSWGSCYFSENKQPIEVVKTTSSNQGDITEVICLRVNLSGTDHYLQLNNNSAGTTITSSSNDSTVENRANHFALAELIREDKDAVEDVITKIDALPTKEEFERKYYDQYGNLNNSIPFSEKMAYRELMRETALAAKEAIDKLTNQQLNFVGKERVEKLLTELEFLWRREPNIVTPANLNATVKLFNYGANINQGHEIGSSGNFIFYNFEIADKVVDGTIETANPAAPNMSNKIGPNGYPVIANIGNLTNVELSHLFDEKQVNPGSQVMTHAATMGNGGGLFQLDNQGYYYYYADTNSAWYNSKTNQFELYDVVVKPEYALYRDDVNNDTASNFFPYNEVMGTVIYDEKYGNGKVVSSVDKTTEVDTAFLNAPTDLWFGMSIEYDFFIPKDAQVNGQEMIFEFHGDDDVFVYVDDVLVLNMGGAHEARDGSINFTTGDVFYESDAGDQNLKLANIFREAGVTEGLNGDKLADYTMHNLKFFYLERGGTYSYAGIKFNMPAIPEDTLAVGKKLSVNQAFIDAKLDYTFRVVSVDENDNVENTSFLTPGITFDIYDAVNHSDTGKDGYVKPDGTFTLKAGQMAVFPEVAGKVINGRKQFVVQELMDDSVKGQYSDIICTANEINDYSVYAAFGTGGNNYGYREAVPVEGTTAYQSAIYSIDSREENYAYKVLYTNDLDESKLDVLNITKTVGQDAVIDPQKAFQIQVKVGNSDQDLIYLPNGTKYDVKNSQGTVLRTETVANDGILTLRVGETATITGFLAGTYWDITEILEVGESYLPIYSGEALYGKIEPSGKAGTFGTGDRVDFTVTNHPCDLLLDVPISKQVLENNTSANFYFTVEQGTWDSANKIWQTTETENGNSITVTGSTVTNGNIALSLLLREGNPVYYKIREQDGSGDFVYDNTEYIVEVTTENTGSGNVASVTKVWKNGTEISYNGDALPFVNYKANLVTITKTVVNTTDAGDTSGTFSFRAEIQYQGNTVTNMADGTGYTVDENGVIEFTLAHEESIQIPVPINGSITVTETNNAGYRTNYQVERNSSMGDLEYGSTVTVSEITEPVTIHFTNQTGYVLPATGGRGIYGYSRFGFLLFFVAIGLLYYRGKVKREN